MFVKYSNNIINYKSASLKKIDKRHGAWIHKHLIFFNLINGRGILSFDGFNKKFIYLRTYMSLANKGKLQIHETLKKDSSP